MSIKQVNKTSRDQLANMDSNQLRNSISNMEHLLNSMHPEDPKRKDIETELCYFLREFDYRMSTYERSK